MPIDPSTIKWDSPAAPSGRATYREGAPLPPPRTPAQARREQNESLASWWAPETAKTDLEIKRAQLETAKTNLKALQMNTPGAKQQQAAQSFLQVTGVDLARGIDPVAAIIKSSTSGRLQHLGAEAYGGITGHATPGMQSIAKLQSIANDLVLSSTGGSLGNQISNTDRDFIAKRMGDIGNPDVPEDQRLAAWEQVKQRVANVTGQKPKPARTARDGWTVTRVR